MPWSWFDFGEAARVPNPADLPTVADNGQQRVYKISLASRTIPFKLFRQAPAGGRGSRPLLVLLHGMGLTIATFRGVAPYLFESHDLALIDYSSFFCSPADANWPAGGVPIRILAESTWAVADALKAERISLAGNSLGGGMCLIAALLRSNDNRVQKILLSNPACYPQPLPFMYRLARIPLVGELLMAITRPEKLIGGLEHIGYIDKSRFDPDLRQRYLHLMSERRNRLRLMDLIRHLPANERDLTPALHLPRLGELSLPILLTWGEQDPLLVPESGPRLARDLPDCTFDPHPDLAHLPHEEALDRIGPTWARFLQS